jgi:hypothetical protein
MDSNEYVPLPLPNSPEGGDTSSFKNIVIFWSIYDG